MSDHDAELAAALAAVDAFLSALANEQAERAALPAAEQTAWRDAARLAGCGVGAARGSRAGWSVVERLRHGAGGFYGVIGL